MPQTKTGTTVLLERAQSKCTWTSQKRLFTQKKSGKLLQAKTGTTVLCERAQSKCTWTSDKKHFMREFSGITPTWTSHKNNFHAETRPPMEQPDQAPALALAVRTPKCGHIVWGTKVMSPIHSFEEGREEL